MRLKQVAVGLISILFLFPVSNGEQNTTREEETIVRTAYAKLSYADEVRIILDALERLGRNKLWNAKANLVDRELESRLNFELSDFHFGKISEIADRKLSEVDGSPTQIGGEVLDVTPSLYNYSAEDKWQGYVAYVKFAWKPSPYSSLIWPAANWPVAKVLQDPEFVGKTYTDYVSYTVNLTFRNKSRTYKTWMLYGKDEQGKTQVYFRDMVTDSTAVLFAFEHSLYPAAFAETDLKTVPFVDKWLYDNARSCSARSEKDNNRLDVCCDPEQGRCGVPQASLAPRNSGIKPVVIDNVE
jgi:hypothetical protein